MTHSPPDVSSRLRESTAASRCRWALGTALSCLLFGGALAVGGCGSGSNPAATEQVTEIPLPQEINLPVPFEARITPASKSHYVDESTCAGCHKAQAADHSRTAHAASLRWISEEEDGRYFDQSVELEDPQQGAIYFPARNGKELQIAGRRGSQRLALTMQLAMGSGQHGVTYFGKLPDGAMMMPRIQRFKNEKGESWGWTPGLQPGAPVPTPLGAALPPDQAHKCFGCHATTLVQTQKGIRFEESRLGIGCQRCHGPAQKHLSAVGKNFALISSGKADPQIPKLGDLSIAQQIAQCETCHRPLDTPSPGQMPRDLARLQGIALRMSRCFTKSEGFSCSSCHNPHQSVMREQAHYEAVCKSCHTGEPEKKACTLKRDSGCVSCHMGQERLSVFGDAVYHNHWIRKKPTQIWKDEPR